MKRIFTLIICCIIGGLSYSQSISKEEAISDIDFFNKTLLEVHYNPFFYVSEEDYYDHVAELKNSIKDSLDSKEFIRKLYTLTSILEDGHTAPAISQGVLGGELKKNHFFPLPAIIEGDKLFLSKKTAAEAGMANAYEIISINDTPAKTLMNNIQNYMGGVPGFKKAFANNVLSYFLYLEGVQAPFNIEYLDRSGNINNFKIEEGTDFIGSIRLTLPGLLEGNSYKIIDGNLGYINFTTMAGSWEDWSALLKAAFTLFKENNIERVAIDLRKNLGGDSTLGEVLFGFITDKKFQLMGMREWKVSQQYKDLLVNNGNTTSEYLLQENGTSWKLGLCNPAPSRMTVEDKFEGEVFFITGPLTFSSANMVADAAKEAGIGTVVGEPSGENTNDFGEVYSFSLPSSRIAMQVTTSMDYGAACNKEIFSPVIPEIMIKPNLEDKIEEKDVVLEHILKIPARSN